MVFDSNYEKALPLNIDLLDLTCDCSDKEYYFATFLEVYYAVRYLNSQAKSNNLHNLFDILINNYIYIWHSDGYYNKMILNSQKYIKIYKEA